jgi:hypothetical protein
VYLARPGDDAGSFVGSRGHTHPSRDVLFWDGSPSAKGVSNMQNGYVQFTLMAIFFGVLVAVPVGWYLLGIKSYGTGDYHQP